MKLIYIDIERKQVWIEDKYDDGQILRESYPKGLVLEMLSNLDSEIRLWRRYLEELERMEALDESDISKDT